MKVTQMKSSQGNLVANQFIITGYIHHGDKDNLPLCTNFVQYFQSYDSVIVKMESDPCGPSSVYLDEKYWNYSKTTSKYRNKFLGETTKETQAKINSGEYVLTNLNKGD